MALRGRRISSLAAAVIVVLGGCGGGSDETGTGSEVSSTTTTAPPPAPVTTTTTATTPPESDPPFMLRLPPRWRDVTALASRESGLAANEAKLVLGRYAGPEVAGSTPDMLVIRTPLQRAIPVRAFAARSVERIRSRHHGSVSAVTETELDGAPAVTFAARLGARNTQRRVLAKHGYGGFQIVFTAPTAGFQRYLPDFERILASWRWTA
jgi:hypothetical protein